MGLWIECRGKGLCHTLPGLLGRAKCQFRGRQGKEAAAWSEVGRQENRVWRLGGIDIGDPFLGTGLAAAQKVADGTGSTWWQVMLVLGAQDGGQEEM